MNKVWGLIAHYKYAITIVGGILLVGFIDENSVLKRIQLEMQISDLKEEIATYKKRHERNTQQLNELKNNPNAVERIARERYFMKADDEDIYVLSDDAQPEENKEDQ